MEVLVATVAVLVEKIVGVRRQMGYLIRYQKNVDNLRNEVVGLEDARDDVQRKVEAARNNVEEIQANVRRWLTRVECITAELQEFAEEVGQAKLKCFNLKARYQIGRKAHKMGLVVKELKDKLDTFNTVGHRVPIGGGAVISTKGYEDFESRKSIFDGVMKALKDDNIRAIGVCGMGGSGKTMLVGKIATQAKEDKLFERIFAVVVSRTPDLKKIQKDIAKELELEFQDEDTDFQKAHLLREWLNKEKILFIIDDIWNKLDLEALGISFGDDHKGSKLLLTSRYQDVLRMYVDGQEIFSVGVLLDDEARYLFSNIVGDFFGTLDFQSVMVELVKECNGLPIAITIVANSLKSRRNVYVWKHALHQLKRANPRQIEGMHETVQQSIKCSYEFLTEEAQSLFLFCSIFEEDAGIPIASLWRILVGLDFFEDVYKMEEVRNRVYTLVENLKDASLLLEGDGSDAFKMHDVVRDAAIYIADKERRMLTIRNSDDLENWSNMKILKDSIGIALSDVELSDLPKRLECPRLNFIFLDFKDNSSAIPNHFFEGAKKLNVLVLSGACFSLLLSSFSCLHNLQSLALYECKLEDVAIIGELKNLRALTLSESNIRHLPIEIGQLIRLQLLDLERCTKLEVIPPNVLSNLRSLEELYMKRSFNQWQVDGESTEGNNTRVSELDHLCILTTLCVHIPNAKILPKAWIFEKLKRYEILIGDDWDWDSDSDDEFEISRMLKLELDRSLQVKDEIEILLKSCEYLDLAPREGIKNIIYEVDKEGFPKLKHLYVRNSTEIQYIINLMGAQCVVFPLLEFLSLDNMINLEKICHDHDQLAMGSFHRLKKLEVSNCDGLILVFSLTILGCFLQLQEIVIENCNSVEEVFDTRGENVDEICVTVFTQLRVLRISNLPKLKHVWSSDPQAIFTFQNLREVSVSNCESLKSLFLVSVAKSLGCFLQLQEIVIENCNSVEEIFDIRGENVDEICHTVFTQLRVLMISNLPKLKHVWSSDPQVISTFQDLRKVSVSNCESLKSLCPVSVAKSRCFSKLKEIVIENCNSIEEVFDTRGGNDIVFTQLRVLRISNLPKFKHVWSSDPQAIFTFQNLREVLVSNCESLKSLFPVSVDKSLGCFLQLQEIVIENCSSVEEVFDTRGENVDEICDTLFTQLTVLRISNLPKLKHVWSSNHQAIFAFQNLREVSVSNCESLKSLFPVSVAKSLGCFSQLQEIVIENCNSVEELFDIRGENVDGICDTVFTQLRVLRISNLPKLKHVWSLDPQAIFTFQIFTFQNLREVLVSNCESLKSLFPVLVAKSLGCFSQLREIVIQNCSSVEEIFDIRGENVDEICDLVFTQLRVLRISNLPKLKHVWSSDHQATFTFQNLRDVSVSNCEILKSLFPVSMAKSLGCFSQLQEIRIQNCNSVEEIFDIRGENVDEICDIVFTQLRVLRISNLPKLKHVWGSDHQAKITFQNLREVSVSNCKILKSLIPVSVA